MQKRSLPFLSCLKTRSKRGDCQCLKSTLTSGFLFVIRKKGKSSCPQGTTWSWHIGRRQPSDAAENPNLTETMAASRGILSLFWAGYLWPIWEAPFNSKGCLRTGRTAECQESFALSYRRQKSDRQEETLSWGRFKVLPWETVCSGWSGIVRDVNRSFRML